MRRKVSMNISVPWRLHELVKRDANGSVSAHVLSILEAHYGRKFDELFIEDAQTIGYREVVEKWGYTYATARCLWRRFGVSRGRLDRAAFERYAKGKPERHGPQDQTDAGAL